MFNLFDAHEARWPDTRPGVLDTGEAAQPGCEPPGAPGPAPAVEGGPVAWARRMKTRLLGALPAGPAP